MTLRRMAVPFVAVGLTALLSLGAGPAASADELISNGSFESNGGVATSIFTDWTVADEANGSGSWYVQTGTGSPLNGFAVAAPPEGDFAAMTDQGGPGSHVLYQDFTVPVGVTSATLSFERFINNQAGVFFTPDNLDFNNDGSNPNQQARVDIITTSADPFSVASGDVLANVFQTMVNDPAVSGYDPQSNDLTSLLQAHEGETLRLRFAETDNQLFFNFGVDSVSLNVNASSVPEPGTVAMLIGLGISGSGLALRRRKK